LIDPDMIEDFEERAAIIEFDGGFPRATAEKRARWMIENKKKQNPETKSRQGR